jgi:hypothetical protein
MEMKERAPSGYDGRVRSVLLIVVAALTASGPALAGPPACFPERTVLWSAWLHDDAGKVFGGVRSGQVVRVVDDAIGDDALVEVEAPVRLRGRVRRDRLLLFTRKEILVEAGWSSWLARAPMWILDGDATRAAARRARSVEDGDHGDARLQEPRIPAPAGDCKRRASSR